MLTPFWFLEKQLYRLRDFLWDYPDLLFLGEQSLIGRLHRLYLLGRPYSHFGAALVASIVVLMFAGSGRLFASAQFRLIEGVVIGTDINGDMQTLSKVNPLLPTSIQLEKDLNELIYEPLIRYEQDGSITPILAQSIVRVAEGAEYEFELRTDVTWHDGRALGVVDVERSLQIIKELDTKYDDNSYVRAVKQMSWERTGDHTIRICTNSADLPPEDPERPCTSVSGQKPILANFLELISIRIIPAHLSEDINALTINSPEPQLNRFPIGTGPYKFAGTGVNTIFLNKNDGYYGAKPQITDIEFKLFKDENAALDALENGEIHNLALVSSGSLREVENFPQIVAHKSPVLQNQYWAIYFNLRKDPDGKPLGPAFFQDAMVRRAISSSIDRGRVLETLLGVGEVARGPIYAGSSYFNAAAGWYEYNQEFAAQMLDGAGWALNQNGVRQKEGVELRFKLSFVDNTDRFRVAESIRQDLEQIGIAVELDRRDLTSLTNEVVTPKIFDTLLYGMNTFIDPDRYELFHSGQPLNLASYAGSEETVKIENKQTVHLPKVDRQLEQGRSFDPLTASDKRKQAYDEFQRLLAADAPVVFLYHPQFIYFANKRVQNLDLTEVNSLEKRFDNIARWRISR